MPTLGEELRHKREQQGITLAEIAEETRIGTRFLKAIETNNFSTLPGGIFTRSFIRAYAKHVGMNEDEAIALYLQQVAETNVEQHEIQPVLTAKPPPSSERVKKPSIAPPSVSKQPSSAAPSKRFEPVAIRKGPARTNWPTIVIGAGIVIFVALIVLALIKQLNQGKGENAPQAPSLAQKNAPPKSAAQAPTQGSSAPGQPEPQAPPVSQGQPLVVQLEAATGDSFVSYQVDDSKPTSFTLRKGETRDVPPAQNQVAIKYGNRLVLKLRINNRDANFPADSPKFASKVIISRDSLQTFFQ